MPPGVAELRVALGGPPPDWDLVIARLPPDIAFVADAAFPATGYPVISSSSAYRMVEDVPLVVPDINPDHIALVDEQRRRRGWDRGFLLTNPNCSTIALVLALAPLHQRFGLEAVVVTTLQAISGAG